MLRVGMRRGGKQGVGNFGAVLFSRRPGCTTAPFAPSIALGLEAVVPGLVLEAVKPLFPEHTSLDKDRPRLVFMAARPWPLIKSIPVCKFYAHRSSSRPVMIWMAMDLGFWKYRHYKSTATSYFACAV